ncbi:MAG: hypothetical protein ACLP2Y_05180 [Limisphaerales bacterium]
MSKNLFLLWRTIDSDFTRVSSGQNPILERFEPVGSAIQKRGALLLQSLLLAHKFGLLRDVGVAVDNLVQK